MEGRLGRYAVCVRPAGGEFRTVGVFEACEVEEVVARYSMGCDVWVSAQPVTGVETGRGSFDNVAALAVVYCDLDVKQGGMPTEEAAEQVIDDLSALLGQRPIFRVRTGHGIQPYWLIEDGEFTTDADRVAGQTLLRQLGRLVSRVAHDRGGAADAVFDLPRMLRAPATMNVKGDPVPVSLLADTGGPLTLEELRERLDEYCPEVASDSQRRGERVNIADALADLPVGVVPCAYGAKALAGLLSEPMGGRHPWLVKSLRRLVELSRKGCLDAMPALEAAIERFQEAVGDDPKRDVIGEVASGLEWALRDECSDSDPCDHRVDVDGHPELPDGAMRSVPVGRRFARECLRDRYVYVPGIGWHQWTGVLWLDLGPDGLDAVAAQAARWAERFIIRLIRQGVDDRVIAAALRYREYSQVLGLVNAARLADGIRVTVDRLDTHPHLLNTPNGVVDLRDGSVRPHDPALLITKVTAAEFVAGFTHPDWTAALEALSEPFRDFLRIRLGQALVGAPTPSDELVLCDGGGENGKTCLLGTALRVAGGYGVLVSDRVLLGNADQHPTELMDLRAARLAYMEETPEARRLDTTRLKRIVGVSTIKARRIAKDPVEFAPVFSMFISTNFPPTVDETDHGTWRRLRRVRFLFTFRKRAEDVVGPSDRLGDATLKVRLGQPDSEGAKAALAWMVSGAVDFFANGAVFPAAPDDVERATHEWRATSDLLLNFVEERLVAASGECVLTSELLAELNDWLEARGHRPWSDTLLASRLTSHSALGPVVERGRTRDLARVSRRGGPFALPIVGQVRVWWGIRFATQADADEEETA